MKTLILSLLLCPWIQDPAELIEKLGSDDPEARDTAAGKLEKLGTRALKPIREAFKKTDDKDVRNRLRNIITNIEIGNAGSVLEGNIDSFIEGYLRSRIGK